jgi:type VI secretion system protein ImpL
LDAIARTSSSEAGAEVSARWCSTVAAPFERSLARTYPFAANGQDAPMADFIEFFRPETGIFWTFVGSALKGDVERAGERYLLAKKPGAAANVFYPSLLGFLDRAREITSAMFPPSASEPVVPFTIHIKPVPNLSSVSFEVDGQIVDYRNGPEERHSMRWPNPAHGGRSAVRVRSAPGGPQGIERVGEWSFFRLLESATLRPLGERGFTASWHFGGAGGADVEIEFEQGRTEAPFFGTRRRGKEPFLLFRDNGARPGLNIPREIGPGTCPSAQ